MCARAVVGPQNQPEPATTRDVTTGLPTFALNAHVTRGARYAHRSHGGAPKLGPFPLDLLGLPFIHTGGSDKPVS